GRHGRDGLRPGLPPRRRHAYVRVDPVRAGRAGTRPRWQPRFPGLLPPGGGDRERPADRHVYRVVAAGGGQRWTRALPPAASRSTSRSVAMEVSPGVVMASAPCAAPYSTAVARSPFSISP